MEMFQCKLLTTVTMKNVDSFDRMLQRMGEKNKGLCDEYLDLIKLSTNKK